MSADTEGQTTARMRWARWFVIVPFLHLGACVADLMSEQVALVGIFCTASDYTWLSASAAGFLIVMYLSLLVGFLAIRFSRLRRLYLILLTLIPVTILGLDRLVAAGILSCDLP